MRWFCLFLSLGVLTGCAQMLGWVDLTGKHRNVDRAHADYEACVKEVDAADPGPKATYDEKEAYRQGLQICMYARGWRPTSLQHL